jgi:two-component system, cell cycle sensor histidine kinase and response regulator CckA
MLQRLSIKARVTLYATAILVVVVLLLAIFSGRLLRGDTERMIGEQQLSMIKLIAAQVDERIQDRTQALTTVAAGGLAELMSDPKRLQARLEQREVLTRLFNRGGFVVDRSGMAIASVPTELGRVGLQYGDRDSFRQVMAGAKSVVSKPVIGKPSGTPVFGMAVPIKSANGETVGVLFGATDLGLPNFLDVVTSNRVGATGGYFVIDPESRRILSATDKSRVLEELPKPGVNPAIDAFAARDEWSTVLVNSRGMEVLSSINSIPSAGWQLIASIPTAELEEPIVATRIRLIVAALLLTTLAAGFMWLVVRRELAPVQGAAKELDGTVGGGAQPLMVRRPDEVGELFNAFNRQLAALKEREEALETTSRLARIGGWEMFPQSDSRVWSAETLRILEIEPPDSPATSKDVQKFYPAESLAKMRAAHVLAVEHGTSWDLELPMTTAKGRPIWARIQGVAHRVDGVTVKLVGTFHDITDRKTLEAELDTQREFDRQVIASMGQGLSVTDGSGAFQLVNPALARLLGYPPEALVGKQSNDFVFTDDQRLNLQYRKERREGKVDQYFVRLLRADGTPVKVSVSGTPQYANGAYVGAVTVITDLTESDRLQTQLQEQRDFANYVLNAMGQGLTIVGSDGRFEFCNPAYAALVGSEVSEIVGKTPDEITYPPDRLVQFDQAKMRRSGQSSTYEVRFPRPDGNFVYASITGTPRFKDGKYAGSIAVITDLTERKRIEAVLEQQRDFAENILSNMGQGVGVSDAEGRFEYINPAYGKLLGWDPLEFVGKTVDDITPDYDIAFVNDQRELRRKGITNTYFTKVVRRDGSVVSVAVTASPRFIRGEYCGAVAVVTDLTERNAMEQELKDQRDFAESIVNSMEQGVGVSDLEGRFEFVNAAYAKMLGEDAAALVGRNLEDFLLDEDKVELQTQLAQRREGASATYESRRLSADGRIVPVLITASPRYLKGKNVGAIAVLTDLSEQRAAERALAESESRFRALMEDVSSIAVQGYRMDGTVVFWNRASERLYGFTAAEAIGKNLLNLVIPAEMREGVEAAIAEMARTGEVEPASELTLKRKDGSSVSVYSTHALTKRNGRVHELFCLDIDLTDQKRAEATREALEERLRQSQKMEAIGTLAGGIAHDFNNILATILGNVELARHSPKLDSNVLESLTEIRKAGTRARDLVGQILSFSRRQATVLKSLDLATIVEESVRLLRATLPGHILLNVRCEAAPPVVGDRTQLQQVLMNLATNSMQAIGGQKGEISISLDAVALSDALLREEPQLQELVSVQGSVVRLMVADTGPGMDEATLQRLFEPFFTTKAVNEGTGLGLAVVHGIVKGHGGIITVTSAVGTGTVFKVYFSATDKLPEDAGVALPESNLPAVATAPVVAGSPVAAHIMYVDDDEALVFLVTRLLERRGFRVSAFTNQRAALDALRGDPNGVSLLVTDYNMPGLSGLDLAREARDIRADLPIAVASGFVDEKLQSMAEAAGVRELIFKANVAEEFCNTVERLARSKLH